jgi:hypothetical protein
MMQLSLAAGAVLLPVVGSEFALARAKLQTALGRVLLVWLASCLAATVWLGRDGSVGVVPVTIFFGGAFLVWFGVRSHIESSILLRMLVLLRGRSLSDSRLVDEYNARYGESMRVAELCRGGLVETGVDGLQLTARGKTVLFLVSKLR